MSSLLTNAEARLRGFLIEPPPQRLIDNLLYLAQCCSLSRHRLPIFVNQLWPVPDGVEIARSVRSDHEEPCLGAKDLDGVVDEVVRTFAKRSDEVVTAAVRATAAWKEASQGDWCLAPEVIRDEFVGSADPWAGLI